MTVYTLWLYGWHSSPSSPCGVHIRRPLSHRLTAQHSPTPHCTSLSHAWHTNTSQHHPHTLWHSFPVHRRCSLCSNLCKCVKREVNLYELIKYLHFLNVSAPCQKCKLNAWINIMSGFDFYVSLIFPRTIKTCGSQKKLRCLIKERESYFLGKSLFTHPCKKIIWSITCMLLLFCWFWLLL